MERFVSTMDSIKITVKPEYSSHRNVWSLCTSDFYRKPYLNMVVSSIIVTMTIIKRQLQLRISCQPKYFITVESGCYTHVSMKHILFVKCIHFSCD